MANAGIELLGSTLIPGFALVLVLALILRLFKSINASTRYLAWMSALILVVTIPLTSSIQFPKVSEIGQILASDSNEVLEVPTPNQSPSIGGADYQSIANQVEASTTISEELINADLAAPLGGTAQSEAPESPTAFITPPETSEFSIAMSPRHCALCIRALGPHCKLDVESPRHELPQYSQAETLWRCARSGTQSTNCADQRPVLWH